MVDKERKSRLLTQIQNQINRVLNIEKSLINEGWQIKRSFMNKMKIPSENAPEAVMKRKLEELKHVNQTDLENNAKSFTYQYRRFDEETGRIKDMDNEKRLITRDVARRGRLARRRLNAMKKKQHEWTGEVPVSLFDLADEKFRELYDANVVASGDDPTKYIPGGRYGYVDSAVLPAVNEVMSMWEDFKNKYKNVEGQKVWYDSVKQKVTDIISTIMNADSTFGSAQQFVINGICQKLARIMNDKGLPPRLNYAGDEMSPIGTPFESDEDTDSNVTETGEQ